MKLVKDLAGAITRTGDPPYRVGQITSIAGLASAPASVTIGQGTSGYEVMISGSPSDYAPGDTVVWVQTNGAPMVISRVPMVGSETNPASPGFAPWHVIGAAGEPAFQNSWVNWGAPYYGARFWQQTDGWVRLAGTVKNGSPITGTIFTLPVGYRPPIEMYFTIVANNVQTPLVVRTTGVVEAFSIASGAFVSLDGVMFPTGWNPDQWITPEWDNNWFGTSGFGGDYVYVYTRDDGMSYITGRMTASGVGGGFLVVPDRARVNREGILLQSCTYNPSMTRYALGGPANGSWLTYQAGGLSTIHQLGGMTWFGEAGRHLENRWTILPYATSWGPFDTGITGTRTYQVPQYMKDHHGVVWLRGLAARSAAVNPIATLPAGFRPAASVIFPALTNPDVFGRVDVASNGDITQVGSTWQNLTGVHFRAEQ